MQHKIQKRCRKNKLRFVARPKSPVWLFPLLEVRPPPPNQFNGIHDFSASCWNHYNCFRPDLPFPVMKVRTKWFCSKSQPGQEKKYTQVVHHASSWHCCPCNNGIVAIVDAQVSLPSLWWGHCCCWCAGVSAIIDLASLLLSLIVKLAL